MYPYNKCPSIVGTPLVCVLRALLARVLRALLARVLRALLARVLRALLARVLRALLARVLRAHASNVSGPSLDADGTRAKRPPCPAGRTRPPRPGRAPASSSARLPVCSTGEACPLLVVRRSQ